MKNKLPPHCYRDRSRVAYKPYLGRQDGKRLYGKPVRLGPKDMPLSKVWEVYERITGKTQGTLRWLLTEYHASQQFAGLRKTTREGYEGYREVMCRFKTSGNVPFGEVPLGAITRRTIRGYLDKYPHPVSANRHIQYLKAAWNWALERYASVPDPNPCMGVKLNEEEVGSRYVTNEEYALVYAVAKTMRVPYFALAMEIAYLCRARRSEVFGLTHGDLLEEGILLHRGKGSRGEITRWNPRLKKAVEEAKAINADAPVVLHTPRHLFHDKAGLAYTKNALDSAWQRIITKAMDPEKTKPALKESFTFHDLKAKGATDSKRENAAGHKSKKMEAVYDRLPKQVEIDYG